MALALVVTSYSAVVGQVSDQIQSLRDAVAIGRDGDWVQAEASVAQADSLTRDLLTWTRLREGEGEFSEYRDFLASHPDWPGLDRLHSSGEASLAKMTDPLAVLAYFETEKPDTGEGVLAYARALKALGRQTDLSVYLSEAWLSVGTTDEEFASLIAEFGALLAPYHVDRAKALLWRWKTDDAERLLPLVPEDEGKLIAARIGFIRKSGDAQQRYESVPTALRSDAGLQYDRYNWLSDQGERTEAIAILKAYSSSAEKLEQPFRWSGWRRSLARWKMREGEYQEAYELAAKHFMSPEDGFNYVDLEWIAGFVALRFLDKPELALSHFQAGLNAVESPISLAQSGYWLGRTYDALGDAASARVAYEAAAKHQTAYYGLLAAERLGQSLDPKLLGTEAFPDWQRAQFLQTEISRAALTLLAAGERSSAVLFVMKLAQTLEREEIGQLGAMLRDMNEPFFQVLVAKTAVTRGIIIHESYFPLHDLAKMDIPVNHELALAIARRESEFNEVVGSPVGALGLMQVMPATAEEVAGDLGLAFSKSRLTSDWRYNAQIGTRYLEMLQEEFGPSPVMIAAGYNAGPSRPKTWMDERGDPRLGEVDVIDWVEMIPFRETRNYVQRVTEAIPIYEARLTGEAGPIRFTELLRGVKPLVRPKSRSDGSIETVQVPVTSPALDAGDAVATSLRPRARGR